MAIKGQITLNEVVIFELDNYPHLDPVNAPVGSLAVVAVSSTVPNIEFNRMWIKIGSSPTDWAPILSVPYNRFQLDVAEKTLRIVDDFINRGVSSGTVGQTGWAVSNAGGSISVPNGDDAGSIGLLNFNCTTSGNRTSIHHSHSAAAGSFSLRHSYGIEVRARIRINNLASTTNNYSFMIGIFDSINTTTDINNGMYIHYTDGGFLAKTARAGVRTAVAAPTFTVNTGVWYNLRIVKRVNVNEVNFYIDSTNIANITTNLPTAGNMIAPAIKMYKTSGTTAVSVSIDYYQLYIDVSPMLRPVY